MSMTVSPSTGAKSDENFESQEIKEDDSGGDSDGDKRGIEGEGLSTKKTPKKKKNKKKSFLQGRIIIPTLDRSAQVWKIS